MSHGLGVMQRAILDALDPARILVDTLTGQPGWYEWQYRESWFEDSQAALVDGEQVYDVGDTRRYLASQLGATRQLYGWNNGGGLRKPVWEPTRQAASSCFAASFTRALYGLIARELLRPVIRIQPGALGLDWKNNLPYVRQRARVEYVVKCYN